MASTKKVAEPSKPRRPPATTVEGRQNQMIGLAVDLAERQLRDGTASSQTINLYLKLGTVREAKEQQKLDHEIELLRVKREQIESVAKIEELYKGAIAAITQYQGRTPEDIDED